MKTKVFNGKTYKNNSIIDIVDYLTLDITDTKYEAISMCNNVILMHQLFERFDAFNGIITVIGEAGLVHRNEGIVINYLT